jgi:hypothetical protein
MHVPRAARFLGRFRLYRFLDVHHRVHHKHMLSNLNVVLPLADWTIGTLRGADGRRIVPFWKRSASRRPRRKVTVVPLPSLPIAGAADELP